MRTTWRVIVTVEDEYFIGRPLAISQHYMPTEHPVTDADREALQRVCDTAWRSILDILNRKLREETSAV